MKSPIAAIVFIIVCYLLMIPASRAEQFVQWQGFDIHYNTFSSLLIPPDVAKAHGISRSKNSIITNISIVQNGIPTTAQVTGQSLNLLGQLTQLAFIEVNERAGIYYLESMSALGSITLPIKLSMKKTLCGFPLELNLPALRRRMISITTESIIRVGPVLNHL